MPSFIRNPKDFWSGMMFLAFGLAGVVIASDYSMGTAGRMGPAYFPTALGWLLIVIGVISVVRSVIVPGEALEKFAYKDLFLILASVLAFGFVIRGGGLVVAIPLMIIISAFASSKFTWKASIALAIGLAVFCILLFVIALGLPMPIVGPWFGG
jgi:hypothetical protein